ncbi:MAG: acetylglutamate kinase [Actinobacteria bacterium]|jgi:acetylglutamate kinase|uniref:acetylglutamate kinase n=1 Tax=freshwater metagenome TaxID=449393 RepID=A0A6J7EWC7_9ZZZZ|nr:acetylglutamate kinase [Actinomycetota bacterium]MSX10775.1 acetylglutamate kinase [Actinomycetota bacterium]MSX69056.1 acetylglutamate kinase [Actinomycetota bacterium]
MTTNRRDPQQAADLLIEVLPYIRHFAGSVMVIKYGGNALAGGDENTALAAFAQDIVMLQAVGISPVVIHGGGPQIAELLAKVGKVSEFRDGLRVTDAETLDLARMVLVGKVNSDIVGALNVHGPVAVGLSGEDANLITADLRDKDLGFVGDVTSVDPTILTRLVSQGIVPVIATIGSDAAGQAYNINADTVAGAVAAALNAEKLIFLTDVPGIRADMNNPESTLAQVSVSDLEAMVASGAASGGMIPKVEACCTAVRGGVRRAHILDGTTPHALLVELFTDGGVGTMVVDS